MESLLAENSRRVCPSRSGRKSVVPLLFRRWPASGTVRSPMAESISPTAPTLLLEPQPAPGGRAPGAVLPRVTLDATALEFLNFAQVHNSVPLVRELAITSTGERARLGRGVLVGLKPCMEPWQGRMSPRAPGATRHLDDLPWVFRG